MSTTHTLPPPSATSTTNSPTRSTTATGYGGTPAIRQRAPGDRDALAALYESLGSEGRYHRFLQGLPYVPPAVLDVLMSRTNTTVVAVETDGRIVGEAVIAATARTGEPPEIGYSVAPEHRRQGIARRLVTEALRRVDPDATPVVRAIIGPENRASLALVRSLGASTRFDDGLMVADIDVGAVCRCRRPRRRSTAA